MHKYLKRIFKDAKPMVHRGHTEEHRAATMLELFFDLAVVIAIASAAGGLHHAVTENHIGAGVLSFSMAFFAIWWSWMNFTWFASSFDTDDVPYRLAVFVQIVGAIVYAAGIQKVFQGEGFGVGLIGFLIMRLSLISLCFRAAIDSPEERQYSLLHAAGYAICQLGWFILIVYLPDNFQVPGFVVMMFAELSVPYIATRVKPGRAHRHHISERYGLLTIIVLGECLLASANGFKALSGHYSTELLVTVVSGLLIPFSMWWLYFERAEAHVRQKATLTFTWGYGHVLVFASAAATGAGMAVIIEFLTGHAKISRQTAILATAIPVAAFLISLWLTFLFSHRKEKKIKPHFFLGALLILASAYFSYGFPAIGVILALVVAVELKTSPVQT